MTAGGAWENGWTRQALIGLLCVLLIGGCWLQPSAPETRAVDFVDKLIREPEAIDDLRALAVLPEGRGPEAYLDDLPVRTAVVFLRARARVGSELKIHTSGTSAPSPEQRFVTVIVSEGLAISATPAVQFQVELRRRDGEWMVTRLSTP